MCMHAFMNTLGHELFIPERWEERERLEKACKRKMCKCALYSCSRPCIPQHPVSPAGSPATTIVLVGLALIF